MRRVRAGDTCVAVKTRGRVCKDMAFYWDEERGGPVCDYHYLWGPLTRRYVIKKGLKEEYHLSDRLIRLLGKPDRTHPNPYHGRPPIKLWLRERVERLIADNPQLVEEVRQQQEARRGHVEEKAAAAREEVAACLRSLRMDALPPMEQLRGEVPARFLDPNAHGQLRDEAVQAYILRTYTSFPEIQEITHRKIGAADLRQAARILCSWRVNRQFGLDLPLPRAGSTIAFDPEGTVDPLQWALGILGYASMEAILMPAGSPQTPGAPADPHRQQSPEETSPGHLGA